MKSRPNPQILTDYNILTISTELIHFHVHFGNVCGIYVQEFNHFVFRSKALHETN